MPGALDGDPPVAREPAVHRRGVLVADVARVLAGDPQRLPVVRRARGERLLGPAAQLVDVASEDGEVGLPGPAVVVSTQVLQQEAADRRVRNGPDQGGLGVCADDTCRGVVVDLSRNRSRRFCSTTCGNRNAVAAYRARQAQA